MIFFNVEIGEKTRKILEDVWLGTVSVVLKCPGEKFQYLHRDTYKLSFRVPDDRDLRTLLEKVGPLVVPSANPEGEIPAHTIKVAKNYFGDKVDFYIDGGEIISEPSALVEIKNGEVKVLRV